MRKCTRYYGQYKDFNFELHYNENIYPDSNPWWTSYFYIKKDQVPESIWNTIKAPVTDYGFDYYATPIINELEFHCGITFYEPQVDSRNMTIWAIKVGCDYNHYWDEGKDYTIETVKADIQESIDSFLALIEQETNKQSSSEEKH